MGGKIESYVLELVSLPTLGIASTVLVEGYRCGILRTIQKKSYEQKFCCPRSRMDNLRREPLPWYHQCLKTLHFLIHVDTSLPKLAELAEQYFAFRPCSLFKEAMALKWSLVKRKKKNKKKRPKDWRNLFVTNGIRYIGVAFLNFTITGATNIVRYTKKIVMNGFVISMLLSNYILTESLCGKVEAILMNTCNAVTFYNPILRMPLSVSQTRNLHFFLLEYGQWIAPDVSQRTNLFGCAFGSINWNWTTKTLSSICRIQLNTCSW